MDTSLQRVQPVAVVERRQPSIKIIRIRKPGFRERYPPICEDQLLDVDSKASIDSLRVGEALEKAFYLSDDLKLEEIPLDEPSLIGSPCGFLLVVGNPSSVKISSVKVQAVLEGPNGERTPISGTQKGTFELEPWEFTSLVLIGHPTAEGIHTLVIALSHDQGINKDITMKRALKFNTTAPFILKWRLKEEEVGNKTTAPLFLESVEFIADSEAISVQCFNESAGVVSQIWKGEKEPGETEKEKEEKEISKGYSFSELLEEITDLHSNALNSYLGNGDFRQFLFKFEMNDDLAADSGTNVVKGDDPKVEGGREGETVASGSVDVGIVILGGIVVRWASPLTRTESVFIGPKISWRRNNSLPLSLEFAEEVGKVRLYEPFTAKIKLTNHTSNPMELSLESAKVEGGIVVDGPFQDVGHVDPMECMIHEFSLFPAAPGIQPVVLLFVDKISKVIHRSQRRLMVVVE